MGTDLSVLGYNVHLFEGTLPGSSLVQMVRDTVYHDEKRQKAITHKILAQDTDIVGLCEVWSDSVKQAIRDNLKKTYKHAFYAETPSDTMGPGLLLLSKHEIIQGEFKAYGESSGFFENLSRKGYYRVKIRVRGLSVTVFLSHTQAGYEAEEEKTRRAQVGELSTAFQNVDSDYALVMGDFNIVAENSNTARETGDYAYLKQALSPAVDAYRCIFPDAWKKGGYTVNGIRNRLVPYFDKADKGAMQRIDYCFLRTPSGIDARSLVEDADVLTGFVYDDPSLGRLTDLSDHYPLRVKIRLP